MRRRTRPHNVNSESDLDGFGPDCSPTRYPPPGIDLPPNPFICIPNFKFDPELHALPDKEEAPCLSRIQLQPSSVTFLERLPNGLSEDAPSGVFKVNIENMGERLLKIFHGVEDDPEGRGFIRETRAYRNLLQGGACSAGVVPHCYGWSEINQAEWPMSQKHDWLLHFRNDVKPLKALVLEFLSDATRMTLRTITPQRAQDAMNALDIIHKAYVVHGDLHPRNLLALPEGRVVWVDFECAASWPWKKRYVNQYRLQAEMGLCWCWMYQKLLPWKWNTLNNLSKTEGQEYQMHIKDLEAVLVSKGATIKS